MITRVAILGLCASMACTRRPSAEECGRAWDHVSEVLRDRAFEDVKRMTPDFPDEGKKGLADQMKQFQATPMGREMRDAMIEACRSKPRARATCILGANTVEELIKVCGMKPSAGHRGGVSLSWPD
jgi:hypothetical protein